MVVIATGSSAFSATLTTSDAVGHLHDQRCRAVPKVGCELLRFETLQRHSPLQLFTAQPFDGEAAARAGDRRLATHGDGRARDPITSARTHHLATQSRRATQSASGNQNNQADQG